MQEPHFRLALLHPRYWLTWFCFACLFLLAQLPYRLQIILGIAIGRLSYYLAVRRRSIAERNIALCFPEKTATERQQLVRAHFDSNGVALFEIGMAWFMPFWRLRKRFLVKGFEHWQPLLDQGKGALLIGLHFNTLEIANICVNRLTTVCLSYRPHNNPVYDLIQHRGRERHNKQSRAIDRYDLRGMVKSLQQGKILWYAPDQDYGSRVSEFVPWFGIQTATLAATPRLLKIAKVPAVGMIYRRQANYRGYEIEFLPIIEGLPSGDDYADLVLINQYIENCVRLNPTEYLWVHRRFKTRPRGEPSLY